jgi:Holliday junction resolvase
MSRKSRGIAFERELVHILQEKGFAAIRIAGSGCTQTPSADILAGNGRSLFAFECKSTSLAHRYISIEAMNEFVTFAHQFGAQAWIAIRFLRTPWFFLHFEDIPKTDKFYRVTQELAKQKGLLIQDLCQDRESEIKNEALNPALT